MNQLEMEQSYVSRGIARYFDGVTKDEARGRDFDNSAAESVLKPHLMDLLPAIRALQTEATQKIEACVTTGRRLAGWEEPLLALQPEVVAYVTMKSLLASARGNYRIQRGVLALGQLLNLEVQWASARAQEAKAAKARSYSPPNRIESMKRRVKEINPKTVGKWLKRFDDIEVDTWDRRVRFQVGAVCLDAAVKSCPTVVHRYDVPEVVNGRNKTAPYIKLSPEFIEQLQSRHDMAAELRPWLLPMIEPPKPWVDAEGGPRGGYHSVEVGVLKESFYRHTSVDGIPQRVLDALNTLQSTKWRINKRVVAVARALMDEDRGPLNYDHLKEMPANVSAEEWEAMPKDAKGVIRNARREVHDHNNRAMAKKLSSLRVVSVAEEFSEYPSIYFPHSIDWRGRAYPMPQDLHPQSDDFAKGMLEFAEGKPLGENGLKWLMRAAAIAWGHGLDKDTRDAQEAWAWANLGNLGQLGIDPIANEWWYEAEEPWQFLGLAFELTQAFQDPEGFVSHAVVAVDGSCNGLQHLSAMGRDPVGAAAVNLLPGQRSDVYSIVAEKVTAAVAHDCIYATDTTSPCYAWDGRVTRKVVKRAVMTTPYGVTRRGIRDQLIGDRHCEGLQGERTANANYLTQKLSEAIAGVIVKGTEVMQWMQSCAEVLAADGQAVQWVSPIGLTCTQHYVSRPTKDIPTLLGRFSLPTGEGGTISKGKQKQSIAPNVIHSFDASHMMLTVLGCPDGMSFAMVHDSYGTHACDVDTLSKVLREEFVKMYSHDWFNSLRADFMFMSETMPPLENPPEVGTLDITQVLKSEYFFS